ncbi:MAG: PD-(D/E)XK nuclease family protein [Candidatus Coatesbacteria bacterium]|nr:PD-(D/E)XK nuclease family protein [Candidatus Coatesbacteria bacterium]
MTVGSYDSPEMPHLTVHLGQDSSAKGTRFESELRRRIAEDRADSLLYLVSCRSFARQIERFLLEDTPGFFSLPLITFSSLFKDIFYMLRYPRRLVDSVTREAIIGVLLENAASDWRLTAIRRSSMGRGLCKTLSRLFAVFGTRSFVDSSSIRNAIEMRGGTIDNKLADALALYDRYRQALSSSNLMDPEHAGALVCDAIRNGDERLARYLGSIELMIVDGFFSFSPLEEQLLMALVGVLPESWIALDCGDDGQDELFELPRRMLSNLRTLGGGVELEVEQHTSNGGQNGLRRELARRLFSADAPAEDSEEGIDLHSQCCLLAANDSREELRAVARTIKGKILDEGCPLSRIAVTSPQSTEKERELKAVLLDHGIPVAAPEALRLQDSVVVQSVLSMSELVGSGFRRELLLDFLSCPFFTPERLVKLMDDIPPIRINQVYIDKLTRLAKISGGGDEGLASYRAGFEALVGHERSGLERSDEVDHPGQNYSEQQISLLLLVLESLNSKLTTPCDPSEFARLFKQLLLDLDLLENMVAEFRGPDDAIRLQLEQEALARFLDMVESHCLGLESAGVSQVMPVDILSALRSRANSELVRVSTGAEGVKLLPMKEAWLAQCDYLFCIGMTEVAFPGPVRRDVFLSTKVRSCLGLRPIDEKVSESKFLTYALLLAPLKQVFFSHPSAADEQPTLMSPYLQELMLAGAGAPTRWADLPENNDCPSNIEGLQLWLGRKAQSSKEPPPQTAIIQDALTLLSSNEQDAKPGITPRGIARRIEASTKRELIDACSCYGGRLSGDVIDETINLLTDDNLSKEHGRRVFSMSSSALESYKACPFKFFASRILRIKPPDEFEPDIAANDLGTLIHEILRVFYENRLRADGSIVVVTAQSLAEARREILEIAREHLEMALKPGLTRERISKQLLEPGALLDSFLDNEAGDKDGWRPLHLEAVFGPMKRPGRETGKLSTEPLLLECDTEGGSELVALHGIIDRIDSRVSDGSLVYRVLDYKTGQVPQPKDLRSGLSLQLPIYVAAVKAILGGEATAAYYQVSPTDEVKIREYKRDDALSKAVENLNQAISEIISGILAGDFAANPSDDDTNKCKYCDYRGICRKK